MPVKQATQLEPGYSKAWARLATAQNVRSTIINVLNAR